MNNIERVNRRTLVQLSGCWKEAQKDKDKELMKKCRRLLEYFCKLYRIPYHGPNWNYGHNLDMQLVCIDK